MDFVIGFIFGYFLKDFVLYLKRISNYKEESWDWISTDNEWGHDDLP